MNIKIPNALKLVISIGGSLLAGGIGSLFTSPSIPGWYANLAKPELAPPNWVFGPVWTTLFVLMGIACWLVWKSGDARKEKVRLGLILFVVQLALNTLWSVVFFGLQNPGLALVEIVILWGTILATILAFGKVSRTAAWLLVPYILWVSFATYLNYAIWTLNK